MKKGAMFGLDARIALAIFGALSVISGAALYSAIQTSNATALVTQMEEIEKALSSYYLDTGVLPGLSGTQDLLIKSLIINPGVEGWNGPYLSMEEKVGVERLTYQGDLYILGFHKSAAWADIVDRTCKKTDASCHVYVCIDNTSQSDAIEEMLDGTTINDLNGKIRTGAGCLFIKTSIPFNPENSPNA